MAFQRAEGMSIIQALAMTVAEIPVFLYTTFGQNTFSQLRLSPGLRKVLFATALGTVALALAAHQLKRRKHKKKQITGGGEGLKPGAVPPIVLPVRRSSSVKKGYPRRVQSPSSKSNDTLSGISSIEPSKHSSKHSSSTHSLASVVVVNSSGANATSVAPWDSREMEEQLSEDPNVEHLYVQGMELFEEALHKWEQALNIGQRGSSSTPIAQSQDLEEETSASILETSQSKEFAGKLESLLSRAYNLQEEFGTNIPHDTMLLDLEGALMFPILEGRRQLLMDDELSTISDDSFFSAAEIFESLQLNESPFIPPKPAAAYEEAVRLVRCGDVTCRTVRTDLLGCYNDQDFLAKLHCVRQAFRLLLQDEGNRLFFGEVGKQMVTGLMVKAEKNPKRFIENYQEMLLFVSKEETWPTTQKELEGRGVVCMNFFDIALDFILMDAFEDLENPPTSVIAVLRNRWLSDSFKETDTTSIVDWWQWSTPQYPQRSPGIGPLTHCRGPDLDGSNHIGVRAGRAIEGIASKTMGALPSIAVPALISMLISGDVTTADQLLMTCPEALATACWSVLKAKRRLLMVPDGFISHFYSVSEHVSPILAYGFLGPKENLTEICHFFKHQILQYLKDMFDLDKVRYTTVESLADDILHLSRRRSDILLGYLGIDSVREMNGNVHVGNGIEEELL